MVSFSFCLLFLCSPKALLYFKCSGSAASEHLPFSAAGEEQTWLCRRPFAGSGVLSAAWLHSPLSKNINTKAAGVYYLKKLNAPSRHFKTSKEHHSYALPFSHSDWFSCV